MPEPQASQAQQSEPQQPQGQVEGTSTASGLPEHRPPGNSALYTTLSSITLPRQNSPESGSPAQYSPAHIPGMRYRPLRLHARGGLGEVFVALDEELHREVALKEIQAARAGDPQQRMRFLMEAEITGGLEHPGIVPVYGLGQHADGRLYYAMRFIQGETLKDAIARYHAAPAQDAGEQRLALRQLLARFVAVCNAVAYAHSRGILHRDIKPANIMLGKYGETLLVDWGLAKAIGQQDDTTAASADPTLRPSSGSDLATQQGEALGTPAFMSPEQAAGELEQLGTATDIYSLGATLYTILTGQPPVQGEDAFELLERARSGTWLPARQVNKEVPPALDAVCRKAMAQKPEDRYTTALALAAEVEHWLGDEPVAAYSEPWTARMRRLMRRHRTLVTSAVMLLGATVLALAVITLLINQSRRESVAEQARTEQQRQHAKTNLDRAMQAVDQMLSRVGEKQLAHVPQFDEERRKILEDALKLYQGLLDENTSDPDVQLETGKAYRRLADINRLLGRYEEAEHAFERSQELLEELTASYPSVPEYQEALGATYNNLGNYYYRAGRLAEDGEVSEKSVTLLERLVREYPGVPAYERRLASAYNSLGVFYRDTGKPDQSEAAYLKSQTIYEQLARAHPEEMDYQHLRAASQNNLGFLYVNIGRTEQAEKAYEKAAEIWEQVTAKHSSIPEYSRALSLCYLNLGRLYVRTGRIDRAQGTDEKAVAIRERLAGEHPSIFEYQREWAGGLTQLGWIYQLKGRLADAEATFQRALTISEKLDQKDPRASEYRAELARSYHQLGWLCQSTQRVNQAETFYQKALAIWEQLAHDHPESPDNPSQLSQLYHELGILYHERMNDYRKAEVAYEKALTLRERLSSRHANVPKYQHDLAWTYQNLTHVWQESEQIDKARAALEKVRDIREKLVHDHPKVLDYAVGLGGSYSDRADLSLKEGNVKAAIELQSQALRILEDVFRREPNQNEARELLAAAYAGRAAALTRLTRHAEALQDLRRALEHVPEEKRVSYRLQQAAVLARMGQHDKAVEEAKVLSRDKDAKPENFSLAAKVYALAYAAVLKQAKPASSRSSDADKLAEKYAIRALDLLKQARARNYFKNPFTVVQLKKDDDFAALQARSDYQDFLAELGKLSH